MELHYKSSIKILKGTSYFFTGPYTSGLGPLAVNVVFVVETDCPEGIEPLKWILLTTENVNNFDEARLITRFYELRWRIEDFHKAWKTGAGAEKQRMQEAKYLEKMIVILSFVAIRLLQLKENFERKQVFGSESQEIHCTTVLSEDEFRVLWLSTERNIKLPLQPENLNWAYRAISKLGGWNDTKKNRKGKLGNDMERMVQITGKNGGILSF